MFYGTIEVVPFPCLCDHDFDRERLAGPSASNIVETPWVGAGCAGVTGVLRLRCRPFRGRQLRSGWQVGWRPKNPTSRAKDAWEMGRPASSWGRLDAPLVMRALQGSFDCVALRFAQGNFAQDDTQKRIW